MKYLLNFALQLEMCHAQVVYHPANFAESPILISVPDIVQSFETFLETFCRVGIAESATGDQGHNTSPLQGLAGEAYICQTRKLDQPGLRQFCLQLVQYFKQGYSTLATENFLECENNLYLSGLREAIELRNYLVRYTRTPRKVYRNGYLFVVVV